MELRHLRYFLAVAEESHFRKAADRLLVSQPTLSLQVQDLEKELEVALFDRIGRRVQLTQAGRVFREYAQRVLITIEEGKIALAELDGMLRGSLTVGVVQTVNAYLTPLVIADFSKDYPQVRLKIEELSASEIEEGIVNRTLDLGVSFLRSTHPEIEIERLFDEEFVLAVGASHRLAGRDKVQLGELSEEPLCLLSPVFRTRQIIDECFARARVHPRTVVEMNSIEGIMAVVDAGGPATILPALGTHGRSFRAVRIEKLTPKRSVCILTPKRHNPLKSRTVFVELLRNAVQSLK